jgi:nitroimidazol reductase NimA-like FMN-containing flavoprotein (pyridoxamine 5'-phosphate oxidase superfamily)
MTGRPDAERPVVVLDEQECWDLLAGEHFGRLGYRLVDEIHVVPVNYGVHEGVLAVRTAAGNKLLAAEMRSEVGFEIDGFVSDDEAWSVLVRGHLRRLDERHARLLENEVPSWVPMLKYEVLEVVPETVSGRRFLLQRD